MYMVEYSNNVETNEWLNSSTRAKKITTALLNHYNFLLDKGYEVVAIFPFGSMNYLCDDENSDVDIYAIIVPEANYYIWGHVIGKTYSGIIKAPDGRSEIKLVPVQDFTKKLLNMDLQTLEVLFSKWNIITPKYYVSLNKILNKKYDFARYDEPKYLYSLLGAFTTTRNHVIKTCDLYEPNDIMYDKQMYQALRLMKTGLYYIHREMFDKALVPWTKETLDEIRTWKYQPTSQKNYMNGLSKLRENYEDEIRQSYFDIKDEYEKNNTLESLEKQNLKSIAENFAKEIILQRIKEELGEF